MCKHYLLQLATNLKNVKSEITLFLYFQYKVSFVKKTSILFSELLVIKLDLHDKFVSTRVLYACIVWWLNINLLVFTNKKKL